MTLKSILSLLWTSFLISLFFWGASKFVTWYPTFNKYLFFFLAFWFSWSIRFYEGRFIALKLVFKLNKRSLNTFFGFLFPFIKFLVIIAGYAYLILTIVNNYQLYDGVLIVGLIAFLLFIILTSLTFLCTMVFLDGFK